MKAFPPSLSLVIARPSPLFGASSRLPLGDGVQHLDVGQRLMPDSGFSAAFSRLACDLPLLVAPSSDESACSGYAPCSNGLRTVRKS